MVRKHFIAHIFHARRVPSVPAQRGGRDMNIHLLRFWAAAILLTAGGAALACDYDAGKTKFLDYANCRYGTDAVVAVDLPEGSAWEQCIYYTEAFRPPKLLAITRQEGDTEKVSVNSRDQIGNPCYLAMRACDQALKTYKAAQG